MTSKAYKILSVERVASVRDIQRNPSKALKGLTRVMRGSQTMGYFFDVLSFDEILEDLEALSSPDLKKRVREARKGIKSNKLHTLESVAAKYGV
ncbi:MAG: hypothetical protein WC766_02935 [Patescibacteria group bacterium]|jgi:hypothetical protein